ncbi:hypothetical protein F4802DRAFT_517602 [Xylaria palmicola]|nr:hypothetical protein F4802DRAFT_517602 [Xylaria palmicola]
MLFFDIQGLLSFMVLAPRPLATLEGPISLCRFPFPDIHAPPRGFSVSQIDEAMHGAEYLSPFPRRADRGTPGRHQRPTAFPSCQTFPESRDKDDRHSATGRQQAENTNGYETWVLDQGG